MTALTQREQKTAAEIATLYCIRYERDGFLAMMGRLGRLMDEKGVPDKDRNDRAMDFESRVSYLIGMYQSEKEMRQ